MKLETLDDLKKALEKLSYQFRNYENMKKNTGELHHIIEERIKRIRASYLNEAVDTLGRQFRLEQMRTAGLYDMVMTIFKILNGMSWDLDFKKAEKVTIKDAKKELEKEQQIPPKISKKIKAKNRKRDKKLKKALEGGARVVDRSISKVAWDIAHNKIKVVSGKLDYRSWQILNCASDKIAQNEWFSKVLFPKIALNKDPAVDTEGCTVIISAKEFKDYIGNQNISNKNIIKIFEDLPKATLKGSVAIPFYYPEYQWVMVDFYVDNICGVAIAYESKEFEKYRSKRKLRGEGSGGEEPVFALIFSNPYGQSFFRHSQRREASQLLNQKLYEIDPNAQELFQAVRWNEKGPIIINAEEVSRAVGWTLPITNFSLRVKRCQKLIDILYENNFINKPIISGKSVEKRSWLFFISKGRGKERKQIN